MKKPPLQDVIVKSREDAPVRRTASVPSSPDGGIRRSPQTHQRPPVKPRKEEPHHNAYEVGEYDTATHPPRRKPPRSRNKSLYPLKKKKWFAIAFAIGLIVVLSSIALSLLFAGATVTVYPKQDNVVVSEEFTVDENGSEGSIPISRMVITETAQREVVALGEKEVEERASGEVTLYNEYSETPQRIIPRTRFESSSGLIYRVSEAVEIPGKNPDGTPGTVEITITAEEPGEEHNIGPDTFTLPGYKEAGLLEHAEKIYAKSTTDMTGGFEGIRRSVASEDRARVVEELKTELKDTLLSKAFSSAKNPEDKYLFKDAVFFEFETLSDELSGTDKVTIRLEGRLHGILFPETEFTKQLAQRAISTYEGSPIRIENMKDLTVSVLPLESGAEDEGDVEAEQFSGKPWEATKYTASVEGKAHFIWEFDKNQLASDFASKKKEILNMPFEGGILESYPGIDRLEVSVRPFWKTSFPQNPEDIHVITELDD